MGRKRAKCFFGRQYIIQKHNSDLISGHRLIDFLSVLDGSDGHTDAVAVRIRSDNKTRIYLFSKVHAHLKGSRILGVR